MVTELGSSWLHLLQVIPDPLPISCLPLYIIIQRGEIPKNNLYKKPT